MHRGHPATLAHNTQCSWYVDVTCKKKIVNFCGEFCDENGFKISDGRTPFRHAEVLLLYLPRPWGEADWVPLVLYDPRHLRFLSGVH